MRSKRPGFEQLEDRRVYSAAVPWLPSAQLSPPARSPAVAAAPVAAESPVSPAAGELGQFEGRKTIPYVSGSLNENQAGAVSTFYVLQDTDFHFVLTAADWSGPSASGVDMSIRDAAGQIVFSMSAAAGKTQVEESYFDAGDYTAEFTRDAASPGGALRFDLGGVTLPLADTTQDPAEASSSSTYAELSFYWLPPHSVSPGFVVQQPAAPPSLTSANIGSAAANVYLPESPAYAVAFPSPANTALAPPSAVATPATELTPAAAIPADPESVAVSALLGNPTSLPLPAGDLPADDLPTTADHCMAPAAPSPNQVSSRWNTSALGDDLLRELSLARAAVIADQAFVAAAADAEPLDASSVAMLARESAAKSRIAESAGLLWQWLVVVNENAAVSWTLAPVGVALGWLWRKWGHLAARQVRPEVRRRSVPCAAR